MPWGGLVGVGSFLYALPEFQFFQDMSQQPPWQELVATDLHGNEWHFRHIFRGWLYFLNGLLDTRVSYCNCFS